MQEQTADEAGSSQDDNGVFSERFLHTTKRFTLRIGQKNVRFRLYNVNAESEEHAGVVFRCVTCRKVFSTAVALRDHSKTHASRKIYTCTECGRKFAFRETFARHLKTHQAMASQQGQRAPMTQRFYCSTCGNCFPSVEELDNHKVECGNQDANATPEKPKQMACVQCGKCFQYRRDLVAHERIHSGERPFECGLCGKKYAQQQSLTTHIKAHTAEHAYRCSTCDYTCKDTSTLRKHEESVHFVNAGGPVRSASEQDDVDAYPQMLIPERFNNIPLEMREGFD
ncbi:zinc finger protein [Aphelenchoides avenae]|nr:zinc finger protein [Aphelenchus avenae]